MGATSHQSHYSGLSRLKFFFALSRTPHGLIDMATPPLGALIWLGGFPSFQVIIVGLITTFAGYTAVYALNDLIDYRSDKEKLQLSGFGDSDNYLDGVLMRHPIAGGFMDFKDGLVWVVVWGCIAIVGAFLLNPFCVAVFLGACAFEVAYCLLLKVSYLRTLVSGAVKTSGAVAAVFAVDPNPSLLFLICLFLWLFLWEIGGQNVPADWVDIEEDKHFQAKTIPVRFGADRASIIIFSTIILSVFMNMVVLHSAQVGFKLPYLATCFFVGAYLLVIPAYRLYRSKERSRAIELFNKASFYPLALLIATGIKLIM